MTTASQNRSESPPAECPMLEGDASACYGKSLQASKELSRSLGAFLEGRTAEERVAWIKTSVDAARPLLQPWVMEILFVIANLGAARFNEMRGLLGLSSRTLSDKLKLLEAEGLVNRDVRSTRPVRVDYSLTRHGREATALASPLFAHLVQRATGAADDAP